MKSSSVVSLHQVSKIYPTAGKDLYAVKDVTLEVQPGEFYSLLGSSGSGKTTTLRLIGGFEIPDYGQVFIGGEEVTTLPPYRRSVHTVFQNYALFPHLTVAENIAYPLRIGKVPRVDVVPRVHEALRMFRIAELGDRRPTQLSGGQQQRVALARALINRPKVLLLDEPLSALDAKIREEVRQELREVQRQTGITFIYVTHDQEEALALSDRIAVMHNGQVEQIGTPRAIYDQPATQFVAQFIGKANFLQGVVQHCQHDRADIDVQGTLIQAIHPGCPVAAHQAVTVMIRPERLKVGNRTADNQIQGRLVSSTYVGQRWELRYETAIGPLTATHLSGEEGLEEPFLLSWNARDCIVLAAGIS